MTENIQDKLIRTYSMLAALRENVDEIPSPNIPKKYVREYHSVLDRLQGIRINVTEFRIPDSEVNSIVTDVGPTNYIGGGGGHVSYSEEKYVDKPFILTKIDAILRYFEITTSEKPRRIGFHTPDNK